jgi:hypothetical protein
MSSSTFQTNLQTQFKGLSKFFGGAIIFLGLLGIFAGFMSGRASLYQDHGVTTTATVTHLSRKPVKVGNTTKPVNFNSVEVSFTTDSGEEQTDSNIANVQDELYNSLEEGSTVEIVYLPESPHTVLIPSDVGRDIKRSPSLYIGGIILLILGVVVFNYGRIRNGLKRPV